MLAEQKRQEVQDVRENGGRPSGSSCSARSKGSGRRD